MEPQTSAGKKWLTDSRGIENKIRERIIAIENEILDDLEISREEFKARKEHKKNK